MKNSRRAHLNRAKQEGGRGQQHSRAATVASIEGLMMKEAASRAQDQSLNIQVQRSQPIDMSQLTECSSQSSLLSKSSSGPAGGGEGGVIDWQCGNAQRPGTFLKTNMTGLSKNGRLQMRSAAGQSIPQVYTKMVETPEGVRSYQHRMKANSTAAEAEENMESKTPRHRNGGRESVHRSSQQSFATASEQGDGTGSAGCYHLGQGTLTWNNSNLSHLGNGSIASATAMPAPADFAKTMKADMDSLALWLARERKKLQSQQESLDTRIREGESAIDARLSKSIEEVTKHGSAVAASIDARLAKSLEEVTKHGSAVAASVKNDCESAKKSAKNVITDLKQSYEEADKSLKESHAKMKKLATETKAQVQEVKAEGRAAQTLYTKATDTLKTVQATTEYFKSLFLDPLKAFTSDGAMIGQKPNPTALMTPPRSSLQELAKKSKDSRVDTVFVIDDPRDLENISPLTMKSRRRRPAFVPIETASRNPVMSELTNHTKRTAANLQPLKKSLAAPSTPTTAAPVSMAIPPKRRRLVSSSSSSNNVSGPSKKKQALKSGPPTKKKVSTLMKQPTSLPTNQQVNAKPVRKTLRRKRGQGTIIGDINFSPA
jgi:hypothetical protein